MQNVTRFNTTLTITRNETTPLITIIFVWREENSILFLMLPTLFHTPESPINTTNPLSDISTKALARRQTGYWSEGPGMEHHTRGLNGVLA